jgi:hypothetical protein
MEVSEWLAAAGSGECGSLANVFLYPGTMPPEVKKFQLHGIMDYAADRGWHSTDYECHPASPNDISIDGILRSSHPL